MKVKDIMSVRVVSVAPTTTYADAAELMHKEKLAGVPVVDEAKKLVGFLSEKDLFRAMYPDYGEFVLTPEAIGDQESSEDRVEDLRAQPIAKFMKGKVITIEPDAPILKAGGIMLSHGIHHLPVVLSGALVGMLDREDIFSAILKHRLGF